MKTLLFLILGSMTLFASALWDPYSATSLERYRESSFRAQFISNDKERFYSTLISLIKDNEHYGIKEIQAYTLDTQHYVDVKQLFFVYPLMRTVAFGKYTSRAFVSHEKAVTYAKQYKADVIDFEKLLHVTKQSMPSDEALMQARYKKRAYPMGQKVYEKACVGKIDATAFMEMGDVKEALVSSQPCGVLDAEKIDALTLYLWNVKRKGDLGEVEGRIEVNEDEKCPVCGMFVAKYPKWAAQLYIKHNEHEHHLSFDGVKDMMKFYFNPSKWGNYASVSQESIMRVAVSDYYSGRGIDGRKAFYVIRSDIYGPMGHEFIPFENEEEAKTFQKEHRGTKMLNFQDIMEAMVYELDTP